MGGHFDTHKKSNDRIKSWAKTLHCIFFGMAINACYLHIWNLANLPGSDVGQYVPSFSAPRQEPWILKGQAQIWAS